MTKSDKSLEETFREIIRSNREPYALCAWGGCRKRFVNHVRSPSSDDLAKGKDHE
jgi:hypothetical protein